MQRDISEKLYYEDVYRRELVTEIIDSETEEGKRWYRFRSTIFYPEGGGQASDRGYVNGYAVEKVKSEDGAVWHLIDGELSGNAELKLDWDYRYQNMRQHTGQHLLSAVFFRLFDFSTVSVHLGEDITLIEFDSSEITEEQLREAEEEANRIIRASLSVEAAFYSFAEAEGKNLRRSLKVEAEPVRLVEIKGYDIIGCGGTHVKNTSEIGYIKIVGVEKLRKHIRVRSKVGKSAEEYYRVLHQAVSASTVLLSSTPEEIPEKIEKIIDESKNRARELRIMTENWLSLLIEKFPPTGDASVFFLEEIPRGHTAFFSGKWVEKYRKAVMFVFSSEERLQYTITLPEESGKNANEFIKLNRDKFGLKGGGRPNQIQGVLELDNFGADDLERLREVFNDFAG
jgi:alanyl-tRNA synthetase